MTVFLVLATIISTLSIFAFFGNAFGNTGGIIIPNMFLLMFGGKSTYNGYTIVWKQYGWLTFLFVLEILIIIVAIFTWDACRRITYSDTSKFIWGILSGVLSLFASIISFCTLAITNIDPRGSKGVTLGFGPIFYSILNIISVLLICAGIIVHFVSAPRSLFGKGYSYGTSSIASLSDSFSSNNLSTTAQPQLSQKQKMDEKEKAELLLKYKELLDAGLLTKEEFDSKKKEIL